jgi:hypothetical protein
MVGEHGQYAAGAQFTVQTAWLVEGAVRSNLLIGERCIFGTMWGCSRLLAVAEFTPLSGASLLGIRRLFVGLGRSDNLPACVRVQFFLG